MRIIKLCAREAEIYIFNYFYLFSLFVCLFYSWPDTNHTNQFKNQFERDIVREDVLRLLHAPEFNLLRMIKVF